MLVGKNKTNQNQSVSPEHYKSCKPCLQWECNSTGKKWINYYIKIPLQNKVWAYQLDGENAAILAEDEHHSKLLVLLHCVPQKGLTFNTLELLYWCKYSALHTNLGAEVDNGRLPWVKSKEKDEGHCLPPHSESSFSALALPSQKWHLRSSTPGSSRWPPLLCASAAGTAPAVAEGGFLLHWGTCHRLSRASLLSDAALKTGCLHRHFLLLLLQHARKKKSTATLTCTQLSQGLVSGSSTSVPCMTWL